MTKNMHDKLKKWLGEHSSPILETAGTKCCDLVYRPSNCSNKQYIISVAFTTHLHSDDPQEYIIEDTGYAVVFPSFWLQIAVDVALAYIEYYIDKYMNENILNNDGNNGSGDNSTGENKPGCNCPGGRPVFPTPPPTCTVPPPPRPKPNLHDDPNNNIAGYFIPGNN